MSAQDHLSPAQFHVEYHTGETEDFTVPREEAEARWDDMADNGVNGRTDITHMKYQVQGKNKMLTRGAMGVPREEAATQQATAEAAHKADDQHRLNQMISKRDWTYNGHRDSLGG